METILIIIGMAAATYLTRYTMIAALGRETSTPSEAEKSPLLRRWLGYVPSAVLAALILPAVLAPQHHLEIGTRTWATLIGAVVAWHTRSALWTIAGGMAAFWLLRAIGA